MSNVRIISDLHFGHKWMASHRNFNDEFHHDEHIIDYWNRTVHKKDLTFIVGDVTMESEKHFYRLDALNGRKVVVGGNHDCRKHTHELLKYVDSITGVLDYKGFWITHFPIHVRELYDNHYKVIRRGNIHGHVHGHSINDKYYYNVSAEALHYVPRTIDELIERNKQIFDKEDNLIENFLLEPWI